MLSGSAPLVCTITSLAALCPEVPLWLLPQQTALVSLWEGYPPGGTDSWEGRELGAPGNRPLHSSLLGQCLASARLLLQLPYPLVRCDPHSSLHRPLGEGGQMWQIKI